MAEPKAESTGRLALQETEFLAGTSIRSLSIPEKAAFKEAY
jgi:hypothetical protein